MNYYTIDDINLRDKTIILRVDFNSPIDLETKKILDTSRIKAHCKTIKDLIKRNAKIVIMAHQGRRGQNDFISLEQHANILSQFIKKRVIFQKNLSIKSIRNAIKKLKNQEVLLLENIRFLAEENKKISDTSKSTFVLGLIDLFDVYIFDAFSSAHRNSLSITGFRKLVTIAGRSMEEELQHLKLLNKPKKPFVIILGGAKIDDVFKLIKNKIFNVEYFLLCGRIGEIFLIARGCNLGKREEELKNKGELKILKKIKKYKNNKKIITPIDLAISKNNERINITLNDLPTEYDICDIGDETTKLFKSYIKRANTIYLKGPMGFYEIKGFENGTKEILRSIASSKAYTIIGGGHSLNAVDMFIKRSKISYISLSGGALLNYIAGEKLPGLEILKKRVSKVVT